MSFVSVEAKCLELSTALPARLRLRLLLHAACDASRLGGGGTSEIVDEGADLVAGSAARAEGVGDGYFLKPTVFSNVSNDMTIAREEIFGPVMSIIPFDTAEEAIAIGNATAYGLGGGVWTRDLSTALRVVEGIQSGVMWVNCYGLIDPLTGFTGSKSSGYGAKGTGAHLDTYLQTKSVYIQA